MCLLQKVVVVVVVEGREDTTCCHGSILIIGPLGCNTLQLVRLCFQYVSVIFASYLPWMIFLFAKSKALQEESMVQHWVASEDRVCLALERVGAKIHRWQQNWRWESGSVWDYLIQGVSLPLSRNCWALWPTCDTSKLFYSLDKRECAGTDILYIHIYIYTYIYICTHIITCACKKEHTYTVYIYIIDIIYYAYINYIFDSVFHEGHLRQKNTPSKRQEAMARAMEAPFFKSLSA